MWYISFPNFGQFFVAQIFIEIDFLASKSDKIVLCHVTSWNWLKSNFWSFWGYYLKVEILGVWDLCILSKMPQIQATFFRQFYPQCETDDLLKMQPDTFSHERIWIHSVEKQEIHSHQRRISLDQLYSHFFCKNVIKE